MPPCVHPGYTTVVASLYTPLGIPPLGGSREPLRTLRTVLGGSREPLRTLITVLEEVPESLSGPETSVKRLPRASREPRNREKYRYKAPESLETGRITPEEAPENLPER